jgi:hypothetical protein
MAELLKVIKEGRNKSLLIFNSAAMGTEQLAFREKFEVTYFPTFIDSFIDPQEEFEKMKKTALEANASASKKHVEKIVAELWAKLSVKIPNYTSMLEIKNDIMDLRKQVEQSIQGLPEASLKFFLVIFMLKKIS